MTQHPELRPAGTPSHLQESNDAGVCVCGCVWEGERESVCTVGKSAARRMTAVTSLS